MIYDLVVDTVVLLVYWNQRLSCRGCFHIVVAVGKVLRDIFRRSAIGPVQRCIRVVSLLLFLHRWLSDDPSVIGCVRSFSLLTGLLWYGSKELSTLQKLL